MGQRGNRFLKKKHMFFSMFFPTCPHKFSDLCGKISPHKEGNIPYYIYAGAE